MKFVIVDDDKITLFVTKHTLVEVLKIEDVASFQEAGEALRFLKTYTGTDTVSVFLDLNMPVISGWDFLEFFSEFNDDLKSRVHIYVISSSIDPRDRSKALLHPNVIAYVSKPITQQYVRETFAHFQLSK